MRKILLLTAILFTVTLAANAQKLSPKAEISILTVSPGDELYTKFGHSAIRVKDPVLNIDWVFNYGTFDFNTPHFYLKFIKGRLNYMLSVQTFKGFVWVYSGENRWVDEQVLDLTQSQKQRIFDFLVWNARPENKFYLYDFFFDNCATRVRDVVFDQLGDSIVFRNYPMKLTYRQAFNRYMRDNPWLLFGENLLVGSIADKKMTLWDAMYLPDFLEQAFDQIKIKSPVGDKPIVKTNQRIIEADREMPRTPWYNPLVVFSLLALIIALSAYFEVKNSRRRRWLDFVLFFLLGLTGVVLALMWGLTDHVATKNNYNILWAFPLHLVYAFFVLKKQLPAWAKLYTSAFFFVYIALFLVYLAGTVTGFWLIPQQVDPGVLPLTVIAIIRLYVIKKV